jgi:hypothetical protein
MIGVGGNADKDAHVRASCFGKAHLQTLSSVSRVLDGRPNRFQEQTLLGVGHFGFLGGKIEELRVELVIIVQETAPFTVDSPIQRGRRIRIIELFIVPARGRHDID